jgi:hypothetical protein
MLYVPLVKRLGASVIALLVGVLAFAPVGVAQHHGGSYSRGGGGGHASGGRQGRYAPPAPGGRYAGPYGYAYPAGTYPPGGYPPGYAPGPYGYRPQAYPPAPPARRPNSLGEDWRLQQEEARFGVRHGRFAPLGRVIETLQRRAPGRQLDAGIEYDGGRAIYRVRWITRQGRRIDFLVDAATGAIISQR